jgi:hypothetical protein
VSACNCCDDPTIQVIYLGAEAVGAIHSVPSCAQNPFVPVTPPVWYLVRTRKQEGSLIKDGEETNYGTGGGENQTTSYHVEDNWEKTETITCNAESGTSTSSCQGEGEVTCTSKFFAQESPESSSCTYDPCTQSGCILNGCASDVSRPGMSDSLVCIDTGSPPSVVTTSTTRTTTLKEGFSCTWDKCVTSSEGTECYGDGSESQQSEYVETITLSGAYSLSNLESDTRAKFPPFTGNYSPSTPAQSVYSLSGRTLSLRRVKVKIFHNPSPTCYLKVWLRKVTPSGNEDFIYEWNGAGNPCLASGETADSVIEGADTWDLLEPTSNGTSTLQIVKYSQLPGYEPTEGVDPDGFPPFAP